MSLESDGHFKLDGTVSKLMKFMILYPGVYFSSSTLSASSGVNHNTVRRTIMIMNNFDLIEFHENDFNKHIFTVTADSFSRFQARIVE